MKKVVLCILDGWGEGSPGPDNAIFQAKTPNWDYFLSISPHLLLQASESWVGLLPGQMGNSEVGHMTLGLGRKLKQDLVRLFEIVQNNSLKDLSPWRNFTKAENKDVHVMGLLSPGGVHSHQEHLGAFCKELHSLGFTIYLHAFLDGRDTPPSSGYGYLKEFLDAHPYVTLATLSGRYYAMDRDSRWDRIEKAYKVMCSPTEWKSDPLAYIHSCYNDAIFDEFIPPVAFNNFKGIKSGSNLLMINFRADRVRQILTDLLKPDFSEFDRPSRPTFEKTLGMTAYSEFLNTLIPPLLLKQTSKNGLGEVIASKGLKQLRIAETEKYAHVTYFFNGGQEIPFKEEDRLLILSPKVATYDLKPAMSANEITAKLIEAINSKQYSLLVVNYANTDMVGHTAIQQATIEAVETVDACLGEVFKACQDTNTILVITADHGNAECLKNPLTHEPHTAHTLNPVPFIVLAEKGMTVALKNNGQKSLEDVAPTVLELLELEVPSEMTGKSLV